MTVSLHRGMEAWAGGGAGEPEKRGPLCGRKSQARGPTAGHDRAAHAPLVRPTLPCAAHLQRRRPRSPAVRPTLPLCRPPAAAQALRVGGHPSVSGSTKEPQQKSQRVYGGGGLKGTPGQSRVRTLGLKRAPRFSPLDPISS